MKKLSNLFMMALSLFAFASCDSNGTDPGTDTKPTVEISDVKSTETTVEFTITTTNADRFEYSVALASEDPSYIEVKGEATKTITVEGLTTGAEYAIVATAYNGELSSETVVKNFKAEAGYVPVNYEKIVLLHKFTATDCPNCPRMITAIEQVQENVENEVVVIAMHGQLYNSQYIIPETRELMSLWGINSYPSGVVDYYMNATGSYSGVYTPVKRSLNDNPAMAGISFSSKLEGNTLTVTGEVAYEETAKYKICAVVVEDGLICNNATGGADDGSGRPWLFNHVARDYATFGDKGSSVEGVFLGEILAGTKQEFTCTVEWNSEWKSENCSVIVYVMKEGKAGKYPITNCNHAKVGETVEAKVVE